MAARSNRFAVTFGPTAANTTYDLYTVPTGYRAIIRSWNVRSLAACTTLLGFNDGTTNYLVESQVDAAANPGTNHRTWIVLNPGDKIQWRCSVANNATIQVSGVLVEV